MGAITKAIIDKILFDLNRDKGKDVITVTDLWNYFNTLQSIPEGGGGGGGDMYKATYDPANLESQVLASAIQIDYLDFLDLIYKTNSNGNNPSLDGLLESQFYRVSNLDVNFYLDNCSYIVQAVLNENGDVYPDLRGTLVKNSQYLGIAEIEFSPFSENIKYLRYNRNDFNGFYDFACKSFSDIEDTTFAGCSFNDTCSLSIINNTVNGSNIVFQNNYITQSNFLCARDGNINITGSYLNYSYVEFNCSSDTYSQYLLNCNINKSAIVFSDNDSAISTSALTTCNVDGVTLNIGKNVSLSNCTFIGKNSGYTITIPDNYTASGKTFVEDEWSNFEHTIELDDVISANTLFLPSPENTFVGIYRTTNLTGSAKTVDLIQPFNALHKFKIYGPSLKDITFNYTFSGSSATDGQIFISQLAATLGLFILQKIWNYLEFQKSDIEGSSNVYLITPNYGIVY